MKIWLDTIHLETISDAVKTGIMAGITTNPSILSKAKNIPETLCHLLDLQKGALAIQVTAQDAEGMIEEGRAIAQFSPRTIVKVFVNNQGIQAIRHLCEEGIPVLGTGIFHPMQVLLAANLGVKYLSPYFSHIADIGNAYETLKTMSNLLQVHSLKAKLLVASVKTLEDLVFCANLGVDSVTIKDDLYYKLVSDHHLLQKFSQKFLQDWEEAQGFGTSIKDLLVEAEVSN